MMALVASSADPLPDDFSWADINGVSYLGPVKSQNFPHACNSGWAFSTIGMLESRIKRRRNASSPDISLSTQVLLSCDNLDFGCLGVLFLIFRVTHPTHSDGLVATISPMKHVTPTRPEAIPRAKSAHPRPSARSVSALIKLAKANKIPKYTTSLCTVLWLLRKQ
jgi:hypothetical protein